MFQTSTRRYHVRFWSAMGAYTALVLIQSYLFDNHLVSSPWRVVVALLPVIPIAFVLYAVIANLREIDELERKIQFEAIAISFGITSVLSIAYGLLEIHAGAPPLNLIWVWALLGGIWFVAFFFVRRQYR